MATILSARFTDFQPPFACTSVDYFGPIEMTLFRRRRRRKRWGCQFF
jgi:hypothetical protein